MANSEKRSYDNSDYDVLVVGAGMVGAAFAALLGNSPQGQQLKIGIIEARPFKAPQGDGFDPRVVALTEASRRMLDEVQAWPTIAAGRVCPYLQMRVWDADGTGMVEFHSDEIRQPNLGHIVENSAILSALLQRIAEIDNIELICPASVQAVAQMPCGGIQVALEGGGELRTRLLVAADGALSRVRELAGLRLREWSYNHGAIVTTVTTEHAHDFIARQRFMASGPLAFLPLQSESGDTHYCSIVWSQQTEAAEHLMALNDEAFCRALGQASEYCLGNIVAVEKRFSFPLRQRHATDYTRPGIALVGDAAHTIHPLAGQGVNLGFQDILVLAEEIEQALVKGLSPGDTLVLSRYQRRRKPQNLGMMAVMEGFKRLFEEQALPVRLLRNLGMNHVNSVAPLKNQIVRRAMGL